MVRDMYSGFGEAFQQSAFQVASIITTTGYATTDFNLWPQVPRTILIMLMLVGSCAGSTGGGFKVSRLVILVKTIRKELHTLLHPRSVKKLKMDGHVLEHEVVRSINVFLIAYVLIFAFSILLIAFDNLDMTTNFSAVATTLNNVGPGLEKVGPTGTFPYFRIFQPLSLPWTCSSADWRSTRSSCCLQEIPGKDIEIMFIEIKKYKGIGTSLRFRFLCWVNHTRKE